MKAEAITMNGMDYGEYEDQLTSSRDPILSGKHELIGININRYIFYNYNFLLTESSLHTPDPDSTEEVTIKDMNYSSK